MPPATLVPPMSMPMASEPSATGCLLRVVGVTDRDGPARRGGRSARSGRGRGGAAPAAWGRRVAARRGVSVGCRGPPAGRLPARSVSTVAARAREVGEPGQGLGAERADHGRTAAQRAPRCRTGRGRRRRVRQRHRHRASRPTGAPEPGAPAADPGAAASGPSSPAGRRAAASAADRRRLSRSRPASSATDPTCSSQRSAPTGPLLLVTLEPHPQLTAAHRGIAARCSGAAPTGG